jgi:hypothetical protein
VFDERPHRAGSFDQVKQSFGLGGGDDRSREKDEKDAHYDELLALKIWQRKSGFENPTSPKIREKPGIQN